MRSLVEQVSVSSATRAAIEGAVGGFSLLEELVRWSFACTPARRVLEVIIQDEFTHDVVVEWDQRLHLVFDTT